MIALVSHQAEHCPAISESAGFVCQSKEACGKGYGSDLFSGRADAGTEVYPPASPAALAAETAAATAADLMYYSARGLAAGGGTENAEMAAMRQRIQSGIKGALVYESSPLQDRARAVLPTAESGSSIEQRAAEMAAAAGCSELEGKARALLRCDLLTAWHMPLDRAFLRARQSEPPRQSVTWYHLRLTRGTYPSCAYVTLRVKTHSGSCFKRRLESDSCRREKHYVLYHNVCLRLAVSSFPAGSRKTSSSGRTNPLA